MTTDRIAWRAADDQVAHAHHPGHPRTLCGVPVIPERLAWPKARDCADCTALVAPRVVRVKATRGAVR